MSKCTKCGTNFVGTPEQPAQPGLCKYCEIENLKAIVARLLAVIDELMPGIGQIACVDYAEINDAPIAAAKALNPNAGMKQAYEKGRW